MLLLHRHLCWCPSFFLSYQQFTCNGLVKYPFFPSLLARYSGNASVSHRARVRLRCHDWRPTPSSRSTSCLAKPVPRGLKMESSRATPCHLVRVDLGAGLSNRTAERRKHWNTAFSLHNAFYSRIKAFSRHSVFYCIIFSDIFTFKRYILNQECLNFQSHRSKLWRENDWRANK